MKTAPDESAGPTPCPRQRRLRRPMNQVLHQQRRPASVLSVAALVVTLEKEWDGVDVSVAWGVCAGFSRTGGSQSARRTACCGSDRFPPAAAPGRWDGVAKALSRAGPRQPLLHAAAPGALETGPRRRLASGGPK